jgi:hypothetical protein
MTSTCDVPEPMAIRGRQLVGFLDGSIKAPEPMAIVVAEDNYKTTIINSM